MKDSRARLYHAVRKEEMALYDSQQSATQSVIPPPQSS